MSLINPTAAQRLIDGVGLSFKADFYESVKQLTNNDVWFEVHTENYCAIGGPRKHMLASLAERFPLSFHGVGGSLGNHTHELSEHLCNVSELVKQFQPALVSEHVAWSIHDHEYFADLLPMKRTAEALRILVDNIDRYQNAVGRPILIENPTHYVDLEADYAEPEFLIEVARRSGCGLLIDITNLFLSEVNCGTNASKFIKQIPARYVGEIHIAGFEADRGLQRRLIDSHSQPVNDEVKTLLALAYRQWGEKPTLLERDANLPEFSALLAEAQQLRHVGQEFIEHVD